MTNSSADWEGIEDDLVTAHVSWFGNPVSTDAFYDHAGAPYGYIASTTEDLSKFLSTVLFDDSSDEIFEGEGGDNYVNGWFYNDEGDYYHGGSTPEYRSQMMFNEDDGFGLVLLTNKYNFTEDGQVTEIVDGIGSILKGEPYDFSPGSNSYMQWGLLVAFVIIAVLMLIHVIRLIKKPAIVKRHQFFLSVVCLVIAAVLIPAVSAAFATPWKTIWLFAPDIAWLILAFVALFVLFGGGR